MAYAYQPLPSAKENIRVLILEPGIDGAPLRGHLETVRRPQESAKFEAISYAWGRLPHKDVINLGDSVHNISESLYSALCQFRESHTSRRLWADQICIDQSNVAERNHQVAMIADIFQYADKVLVWLGKAEVHDETLMWLLRTLGRFQAALYLDVPSSDPDPEVFDELQAFLEDPLAASHLHPPETSGRTPHSLAQDILAFSAKEYFERLWPIQEITLCRSALFFAGSHSIEVNQLGDALECLMFRTRAYDEHLLGIELRSDARLCDKLIPLGSLIASRNPERYHIVSFNMRSQGAQSLVHALKLTASLKSTLPHDRIFSLRRIVNIESHHDLLPDYEMEVGELWRRSSIAMLQLPSPRSKGPTGNSSKYPCSSILLALSGTQPESDARLAHPSWVHDYERLTAASCNKIGLYTEYAWRFHAGASSIHGSRMIPFRTTLLNSTTLAASGRLICRIDNVGPTTTRLAEPRRSQSPRDYIWADVLPWAMSCHSFCSPSNHEELCNLQDLLAQGLGQIDGVYGEEERQDVLCAVEQQYRAQPKLETFCSQQDLTFILAKFAHQLGKYLIDIPALDFSRTLAHSGSTYCCVPLTAHSGDYIYVLEGAEQALVLRKCENGCFRAVGDAYVPNLMQGEAWSQQIETVDLRIC